MSKINIVAEPEIKNDADEVITNIQTDGPARGIFFLVVV